MTTGISGLDIKLGLRALVKFPLLTVVGGVSITVAVVLAAAWFEFSWDLNSPALPFEDSNRIVRVQNLDVAEAATEPPSLHDFEAWRNELESIEGLSAVSPFESTLGTEDGRSLTVDGARVTASMFQVLRVAPVLGRPLIAADMEPGAPAAIVIGDEVWRRLFDRDSSVIGRTILLGTLTSTVVGVMPEGFGFPGNEEFWVPLRDRAFDYERGEGPPLLVFGRLAAGSTLEQGQAELTAIGARMAAEFPATNEGLQPQVGALVDLGWQATFSAAVNLVFMLLLVVIAANVATLVVARTATRDGEIAIRSALGASRRRIVLQLCTESLVLTVAAASAGLAIAGWGIDRGMDLFWEVQQSRPPYWWDNDMSPMTIAYMMGLAVLGAAVIGGIPALRATGRRVQPALSRLGSGGSGMSFGRISTAVIVLQVALCVIFVPLAVVRGQELLQEAGITTATSRFAADQYLSGSLTRNTEVPPSAMTESALREFLARTAELQDEVRRRLAAETGVSGVTFYGRLPGFNHSQEAIVVEDEVMASDTAVEHSARSLSVDLDFFEIANTSLVAGRTFQPVDLVRDRRSDRVAAVRRRGAQWPACDRPPVALPRAWR